MIAMASLRPDHDETCCEQAGVIAAGSLISAAGCVALLGIARGTSYWAMCAQLLAMGGVHNDQVWKWKHK